VTEPETPPVAEPDLTPGPGPTPDAERKATTTSVSGNATRKKVKVGGQVVPAPGAGQVAVELLRKKGHDFLSAGSAALDLQSFGSFAATFKNPKHARKCELVAAYAGNAALLPSEATAKFRC
jgi:hypothetical protein